MDELLVFLPCNKLPLVAGALHVILAHPTGSSTNIKNKSKFGQTVTNAYVTAWLS